MVTMTADDVAQGISNDEFILHYQPKVSLTTKRIVGAEALARWQRPDGVLLPPAAFIPVAERSGQIKDLTLRLLSKLVRDLCARDLGEQFSVSLNVTASDLADSVLTERILAALEDEGLPPSALEIEMTETQALKAGKAALDKVEALARAGVGLVMDDYGVGYSSIDTLSQWPFTSIKLDQGIVGRMLHSSKNATIVRASIRLGHELGLKVVAEGVETAAQHDFLVEAGCQLAQGYLISRPLPFEEFDVFRKNVGKCRGMPIGLVHMAIVDHVQWRRQMVSFAIQRSSLPPDSPVRQMDGYPALCITKCALGKWYVGEGRYFAGTPPYQGLDAPHRALHDLGGQLVGQVRGGAGLEAIVPLLVELKRASTALVCLLEELEDAGLQALYTSPPTECPYERAPGRDASSKEQRHGS